MMNRHIIVLKISDYNEVDGFISPRAAAPGFITQTAPLPPRQN